MNGLFAADFSGTLGTWVAAVTTLAVWSYLVGGRRLFAHLQHLLAGLATGYLALIAIREVLAPRLVTPLVTHPASNPLLVLALAAAVILAGAAWLPRRIVTPVAAIMVGATAAFALGGAVVGTLLPQLAAAVLRPSAGLGGLLDGMLALVITVLVLLAFLRGPATGQLSGRISTVGRWLLVGGIGGWLGFLLVSRLALLVDRLGFLVGDWLGLLR